jgi:hypothetical protein
MIRTYFGIIILLCQSLTYSLFASQDEIQNLIVRIAVTYNNSRTKNAFGLIYSERKGIVSIVTSDDLFLNTDLKINNIIVFFGNENSHLNAKLFKRFPSYRIALIQINTPDGFIWPKINRTQEPGIEEIIFIYGRYGDINEKSERTTGYINRVDAFSFEIESTSSDKGFAGLPVVHNSEIVGITTEDLGVRIIAIPMSILGIIISKDLEIVPDNFIIGAPNLIVGISGKIPVCLNPEYFVLFKNISVSRGFFFETGITSKLSLRFDYDSKLSSISFRRLSYGVYNQAKTELWGYKISLVFKERQFFGQKILYYGSIGYSRLHQDLFIRSDNQEWQPLEQISTSGNSVPPVCNFINIDANSRILLFERLTGDFSIGISLTGKNHLITDPVTLEQKPARLGFNFGLSLGYLIVNRNTSKSYIY